MDSDGVHKLSLNTIHDSTITNINLYGDRAQVSRSYKVNVLAGQTKLMISCLPNVVDHESLRRSWSGHYPGVTAFKMEMEEPEETSPHLEELNERLGQAQKTLERCNKALKAIDTYINKISIEHLDISKLGEAMDVYDTAEEKWDNRIRAVEQEIKLIKDKIDEETSRLENNSTVANKKLRTRVLVGLFAAEAAELQINLIYAVSHASWKASYDIRVDMENQGTLAKVVYKADITQKTGESWENIPITLETSRPTFGVDIPVLSAWHISHTTLSHTASGLGRGGAMRHRRISPDDDDLDYIPAATAIVTSQGSVNATFRLPGLTTIPSDDEEHGVTIADLELPANISWVCLPKGDTHVHLEASITNTSDYTFIRGKSNVYVDQSFISRSEVPGVSPREVFKCPLGVDPSVLVTYYPRTKSVSEIGFYNKSLNRTYSQLIVIHNTKSVAISGLKVTDTIPVSQDANITVNLISPALSSPVLVTSGPAKGAQSVHVSEGVIAQWNGGDEFGSMSALGRDGRLDWVCTMPAHGKVNLTLQWDVISSQKGEIYGIS